MSRNENYRIGSGSDQHHIQSVILNAEVTPDLLSSSPCVSGTTPDRSFSSSTPSSSYSLSLCSPTSELIDGDVNHWFSSDTPHLETLLQDLSCYTLPSFFESRETIHIPKKITRLLDLRLIPDLDTINPVRELAEEQLLIFLSNLSNTYYLGEPWKELHSEILQRQVAFRKGDNTYKRIIDVLLKGTKKNGPIIEVDDSYQIGVKSKTYRLSDAYFAKGIETYKLTHPKALQLRKREYFRSLNSAIDNPIARNLIRVYADLELPTTDELKTKARELTKAHYRTKKGKLLTFLNKNSRTRWKDAHERSFVEDSLELYELLTSNGYLIPVVSSERNGGRVIDSFSLMPSWIRNEVRIEGRPTMEVDYQALHPNLAIALYGGKNGGITHDEVAQALNVDRSLVKVEHLAFFNRRWEDMERSPLFAFYQQREPEMLQRIRQDKKEHGHTITSKKMFALEVRMMTEVIERLNVKGVNVLYVYDALVCADKHIKLVRNTMNAVAQHFSVSTIAK